MRWILILLALTLSAPSAALAEDVTIPLSDGTSLKAHLLRPAGAAIGPAIVALHGCGGAYGVRDRLWQEKLVGAGHIMLFPDSFGSRGLGSQCRNSKRTVTSFVVRRADAIASAAWLAAQPGTPAGGVALLGWSDGGSTVVAAATAAPDLPPGLIRGLVAFYPGCFAATRNPAWLPVAPMLILMGAADDWTPAQPCQRVADRIPPPALTMVAYPGAYHDFDAPGGLRVMQNIPSSQNADKSVHAGTDPAAQADALVRVPAFLQALPLAK